MLFACEAMDFKFLWKRGEGLGRVDVWNRETEAVTQHRDTSSDPFAFLVTEEIIGCRFVVSLAIQG